jgi:cellulose biosynthesis protein BcsQ
VKTIAFYSIKGGVGKTAACVNLAYLAATEDAATLLCDLDPRGPSTFYFRIQPKSKHNSRKFLKGGKRIGKAIRGTDFEGLDLLPADLSYRNLDILLT